MNANEFRDELVSLLSGFPEILGIGQTGDLNAPLIPGRSDIDLFVICESVPEKAARREWYRALEAHFESLQMEVCAGGIWGYGDIFMVQGVDVMPMYFPVSEMRGYLQEVLAGQHLEKQGRFYPIGRLAGIETLNVLHEKNSSWTELITLVKVHPKALFDAWYAAETACLLDEEDLGRAELRHEVLFYHQVCEEFLDHFLQALYAKNNRYFPSRKRTEAALAEFEVIPENCFDRLMTIIRLGSSPETIEASVQALRELAQELLSL